MLDNTPNQQSMLIYVYNSDAYILAKGTITITGGPVAADEAVKRAKQRSKGELFKIVHHSLTA